MHSLTVQWICAGNASAFWRVHLSLWSSILFSLNQSCDLWKSVPLIFDFFFVGHILTKRGKFDFVSVHCGLDQGTNATSLRFISLFPECVVDKFPQCCKCTRSYAWIDHAMFLIIFFSDDNCLSLSFPDRFVLTTDGSVMQRTMVKYGYYSSLNLMTCWCISHGNRGIRMCNLNEERLWSRRVNIHPGEFPMPHNIISFDKDRGP